MSLMNPASSSWKTTSSYLCFVTSRWGLFFGQAVNLDFHVVARTVTLTPIVSLPTHLCPFFGLTCSRTPVPSTDHVIQHVFNYKNMLHKYTLLIYTWLTIIILNLAEDEIRHHYTWTTKMHFKLLHFFKLLSLLTFMQPLHQVYTTTFETASLFYIFVKCYFLSHNLLEGQS